MSRKELLLHSLCVCVRALTLDQAMRLLGVEDVTNLRRFLKPLVAADLVKLVRVLAKPVPEMREPLLTYDPTAGGFGEMDLHENRFARVIYRAALRWDELSAVLTPCVVATRKAGQLYGVQRSETLAKPLQVTHDLTVTEVFLFRQVSDPVHAQYWRGEDSIDFKLGDKTLDAWIVESSQAPPKTGIEIVGADYTHDKLLAIHGECNRRGLSYELW